MLIGKKTRRLRQQLDATVRRTALPADKLVVTKSTLDRLSPLSSHFGGTPYAEEGDEWPTWGTDEHPYDFVCQIRLSECRHAPQLPFDLFTVFVNWQATEDDDIDAYCVIRTYQDLDAFNCVELTQPPAVAENDYRVRPCEIAFESTLTYPTSYSLVPEIDAALQPFSKPQAEYNKSLRRLGYHEADFSRVGGDPFWVQADWFERDEMVLVAQISYEVSANNCIGDAAPLYIAVTSDNRTTPLVDFQSY